ncbi:MAG TPA: hypothetical protein VHH34_18655, partial [Pseudonocardiaceae bacterium]|nr:hypothetical protein [Pseudonocardiaceae bacterium]
GAAGVPLGQIAQRLASSRATVLLLVTLAVFWALQTQLLVMFPARAGVVAAGSAQQAAWLVSILFLVNGVLFVVLQVTLTGRLGSVTPHQQLRIGGALVAVAVCLAILATSLALLIVAIAVFTLGEVLALPSVELVVSDLAPSELLGSYFGVASVAAGLGTGIGSAVGGVLAGSSALAAAAGFATLAAMLALLTTQLRVHCAVVGAQR